MVGVPIAKACWIVEGDICCHALIAGDVIE